MEINHFDLTLVLTLLLPTLDAVFFRFFLLNLASFKLFYFVVLLLLET
jgi:hypothetical protein